MFQGVLHIHMKGHIMMHLAYIFHTGSIRFIHLRSGPRFSTGLLSTYLIPREPHKNKNTTADECVKKVLQK